MEFYFGNFEILFNQQIPANFHERTKILTNFPERTKVSTSFLREQYKSAQVPREHK